MVAPTTASYLLPAMPGAGAIDRGDFGENERVWGNIEQLGNGVTISAEMRGISNRFEGAVDAGKWKQIIKFVSALSLPLLGFVAISKRNPYLLGACLISFVTVGFLIRKLNNHMKKFMDYTKTKNDELLRLTNIFVEMISELKRVSTVESNGAISEPNILCIKKHYASLKKIADRVFVPTRFMDFIQIKYLIDQVKHQATGIVRDQKQRIEAMS